METGTGRARLVLEGRGGREIHPLEGEVVTLGRDPQSTIALSDPRVSRHHLRLEAGPSGWKLVDLDSQNGTTRNGRRVQAAMLEHGDVIVVGSRRLRFEDGPGERADVGASTTELPLIGGPALPAETREALRLDRLQGILHAGAERGFLMRSEKSGMTFAAARNIAREDLQRPEFQVSWSIAIQAGTRGEAVLAVDASEDDRFRALESVESLALRSVLAVPIKGESGVLGVIYVDNSLSRGAFTEDDLSLVSMLADQAAIAISRRRMLQDLRERRRQVEALNEKLAAEVREKDSELEQMRATTPGDVAPGRVRRLLGNSARMDELRALLAKVAATDFPVLVTGESGTGKELVAQAIHAQSERHAGAFVSLNCAAIPETLLESELFGATRGAYTGADRDRPGLFRTADGGTLFLDEVSEMSPALQAGLLRVLQEGEIRPVGSQEMVQVDVRLIAATNKPLQKLVTEGSFREDLYFRLKVLPVAVPPLRERREDIPELMAWFFRESGRDPAPAVDPEALDALLSYSWPGNVRELENEVKRLVVLGGDPILKPALSPRVLESGDMLVGSESSYHDLDALVRAVETREIQKALNRTDGNKTQAAGLLGISRFTLQRKLDKYGMLPEAD